MTSYKRVENIVIDCASLTDELQKTDQLMKERKELFHKMWEEEQQRITIEQTIFKEQVRSFFSLQGGSPLQVARWRLERTYNTIAVLVNGTESNSEREL